MQFLTVTSRFIKLLICCVAEWKLGPDEHSQVSEQGRNSALLPSVCSAVPAALGIAMTVLPIVRGTVWSLGGFTSKKSGSSGRIAAPTLGQYRFKTGHSSPELAVPTKTFKYSELQVSLVHSEKLQSKPAMSHLGFGKYFTDHLFEVEWDQKVGWSRPAICPFHDLLIHPAASVLHYAIEVFEGMKAYRGTDGTVRLFRPDINMRRLLKGARRASLPEFDTEELLKCLKELIRIEREWVPCSETASLYIRPTFIGTEPTLGVSQPSKALLYIIMSPVGAYFDRGFKPIALLAEPRYVRSWPGGCGEYKLGSNYGRSIYPLEQAEWYGLQQVLWLQGEGHWITEAGTMNIFLLIRNPDGRRELITPPLQGLILPGVIRQSVIEICRQWNEFKVTERAVSMQEVVQFCQENRLLEFFGTGTGCGTICPVHLISYLGVDYHIPTVEHADSLCLRLLNYMTAIYYGRISHEWGVVVE